MNVSSKPALVLAVAALFSTGCTAVQKGLGLKQDLEKEAVQSITAEIDRGAICPGEDADLIVDVVLADGRSLRTEGAGEGKVTWDSFRFEAHNVSVREDGMVSARPDPRPALASPPWILIRAVHHPAATTTLPVQLRYDCAYRADFSARDGSDGDTGDSGIDEDTWGAIDGQPGGAGARGENGANIVMQTALLSSDAGEEWLQVSVAEAGTQSPRLFLIHPRGSLTVISRGGNGGDGGQGGRGGKPSGLGGHGGNGGAGGNGGRILHVLDVDAAKYQDRFRFEVAPGSGGDAGAEGEHAREASSEGPDKRIGAPPVPGRDGRPGFVTLELEPVEPLW